MMNVRTTMIHTVAALSVAVFSAAAGAVGSVQFMDLQWLQPGVAVQDVGSYFSDKLQPLVRKHGGLHERQSWCAMRTTQQHRMEEY